MTICDKINEDLISVAQFLKMLSDMAGTPVDQCVRIGEDEYILSLRKKE